jgi:hypothetical protein
VKKTSTDLEKASPIFFIIIRYNRHKIGCWEKVKFLFKVFKCLLSVSIFSSHTLEQWWIPLVLGSCFWVPGWPPRAPTVLTEQGFFVFQGQTLPQASSVIGGLLRPTCGSGREMHHRSQSQLWSPGQWNVMWGLDGSETRGSLISVLFTTNMAGLFSQAVFLDVPYDIF